MRKISVSCVQRGSEPTHNVKGKKSQKGDGFPELLEETMEKSNKSNKDQSKGETIYPFILGLHLEQSRVKPLPPIVDMGNMDGQKLVDLIPLESKDGIFDNFYPSAETRPSIVDMGNMDGQKLVDLIPLESKDGILNNFYPSAETRPLVGEEMLSTQVQAKGTEIASVGKAEDTLVEEVTYFTRVEPFHTELKRGLKDLEIGSEKVLSSEKTPIEWEEKSEHTDNSKAFSSEEYRLKQMAPLTGMDTKVTMKVQSNGLEDINVKSINDSIIKLLETTTEGESTIMKVKLYPEDLGTVDVILKMEEGKIIARLTVENEQVKQLFLSKASELNDNLLKQNIPIDKVEIDLSFNSDPNTSGGFKGNDHFNDGQKSYLAKEFTQVDMVIEKREETLMGRESISILA